MGGAQGGIDDACGCRHVQRLPAGNNDRICRLHRREARRDGDVVAGLGPDRSGVRGAHLESVAQRQVQAAKAEDFGRDRQLEG
jgi:hypothetical protein